MAYINKKTREEVWEKYGRKCSYCGRDLEYKQLQVDHIKPYWHNLVKEGKDFKRRNKGEHEVENFNPSCSRCNRWKSTYTIEQFRGEIQKQLERLRRDSSNYRLAFDYGMIGEDNSPILFWFEKYVNIK
jgi:5-methylcytosine-specific restriction endonuclease McrA